MTRAWRARASLLTALGAVGVHQGRYLIAPPEHVHSAAHDYLVWLVPLLALLGFGMLAEFALRIARRRSEQTGLPAPVVIFTFALFLLVSIYLVQESAESLLTHGALPAEVFAGGGLIALPLAVLAAALLTFLLKGASAVLRRIAAARPVASRGHVRSAHPVSAELAPRRAELALGLAPRGPPIAAR